MEASAAIALPRTILVVDDEPMVRSVVCRLLQEWDFKVVEADDGRTALHLAKKLRGVLSMVITDLAMPYMDGYEFASSFRLLYPDVPILFMTGQCPDALVGDLSNGREHLLFKPFGPDSLLDTVARLLESRINERRTPA
jgi:CheY-like chemotaxis protein